MSITAESSQQNLLNQLESLVTASRRMLEFMSGAKSGVEAALSAALKELEIKTYDLKNDLMVSAYDYEREGAPSVDINPKGRNAKWLDLTTGAVWVCRDNTPDQNVWISSQDIQNTLSSMQNTLSSMQSNLNAQSKTNTDTLNAQIENINRLMSAMEGKINDKLAKIKAFDYIELNDPSTSTNPTRMGAVWLNKLTSVLFSCIDNTANANIWVGGGKYIGGIFNNFQPKDPDENTQGVFYVNTATQKIFIRHQDTWVEIAELKLTTDIAAETLADRVLYLQGLSLFYMDKDTPIYSLDYAQMGTPTPTLNPAKQFALYFDVENKIFYICLDDTTDANVWEQMETKAIQETPNIITKPSTEVRPSEPGFGGGLASDKALKRLGLEKLSGTEDRDSIEYANYVHTATGSIMHFTPAMYQKITFESGAPYYGLKVEFSKEKKEGFVLNRSFINGGQIVEGVFMDKFINSIKNGKNVSVKDGIPASLHSSYQPISQLGAAMNFGGCIDAAKKRGGTFLTPKWVRDYYILLMLAKYQKCYDEGTLYDLIAWANTTPHVVRGCNNGALSDHNDNTIKYAATGDGRGGKTGGVSTELDLKKISILGDGASPVDFNGVMYEVMFGLNGNGGKLGMLKNGVDIQGLTSQNAFTTDYYDYFTLPFSGAGFYGNGSEQVLECATEQDTDAWRRDCLLIPKAKYGSSADIFGGDSVTLAAPNQCMPYVGAYWNATGAFGAFFANLSTSASSSSYGDYGGYNYGFRACALGEVLR